MQATAQAQIYSKTDDLSIFREVGKTEIALRIIEYLQLLRIMRSRIEFHIIMEKRSPSGFLFLFVTCLITASVMKWGYPVANSDLRIL